MKDHQQNALIRAYQMFLSFEQQNLELYKITTGKYFEGSAKAYRIAAQHIKMLCEAFDIELLDLGITPEMEAEAEQDRQTWIEATADFDTREIITDETE